MTQMLATNSMHELDALADPLAAQVSQQFFKTAPGQYGEGDVFIGVRVPKVRQIAKRYVGMPEGELWQLLMSPIHEHRLCAVIIMAYAFPHLTDVDKEHMYKLYMRGLQKNCINNWDIIDVSAEHIVGAWLERRDKSRLYELAKSTNVWSRRVAIISTFCYIKRGDATHTIALACVLLHDEHDLIQKAVGWMLREAGKRVDQAVLCAFLDEHAATMPRTMLRYAVERLDPELRAHYMRARSTTA